MKKIAIAALVTSVLASSASAEMSYYGKAALGLGMVPSGKTVFNGTEPFGVTGAKSVVPGFTFGGGVKYDGWRVDFTFNMHTKASYTQKYEDEKTALTKRFGQYNTVSTAAASAAAALATVNGAGLGNVTALTADQQKALDEAYGTKFNVADAKRYSFELAGYYDFAGVSEMVTPFVGASLGYANGKIDMSNSFSAHAKALAGVKFANFPELAGDDKAKYDAVIKGLESLYKMSSFTASGTVGASFAVAEGVAVDFAYTLQNDGTVLNKSALDDVTKAAYDSANDDITAAGFRAGLLPADFADAGKMSEATLKKSAGRYFTNKFALGVRFSF